MIDVHLHLHETIDDGLGPRRHGGRTIVWRSSPECPSCRARLRFAQLYNAPRMGTLARGLLRSVLESEIEKLKAGSTSNPVAGVAAAALSEVLAEAPAGDRIPIALAKNHPLRELVARSIDPLIPSATSGLGAIFDVGEVAVMMDSHAPRVALETLWRLVDAHGSGDNGEWGIVPAVASATAQFCPELGDEGDRNRLAIDAGDGPIWSRYHIPTPARPPIIVNVVTYLTPGGPSKTSIYLAVSRMSGPPGHSWA